MVGLDVVEQPLVVGHDDHRPIGTAKCIDTVGHHPQGIDIEARVGFIENRQFRFQHGHLQDLVALLLPARETGIHVTLKKLCVHLDEIESFANQFHKPGRIERRLAACGANGVQRGLQEHHIIHTGQFDRILHGKEYTAVCPLFGSQRKQVLAPE